MNPQVSKTPNSSPRPDQKRRNSAFKRLMSVHWWMAGIYLWLYVGGKVMVYLERENPVRSFMYDFHKSLGVLTIFLLGWRVIVLLQVWWRKYTKRKPPLTMAWWRKTLLHALIYGFMIAVPLTGIFLSNSFKAENVYLFGLLMPDLFPQNQELLDLGRDLHFWFAFTFLAFIIVHTIDQWKVVKALWRRFSLWIQKRFSPTA